MRTLNPRLSTLVATAILENIAEMSDDEQKEQLTLIDDIFRVKKLLYGLGEAQHAEFISATQWWETFDELMEYSLTQLRIIYSGYSSKVNQLTAEKHAAALQK